MNDYWASASLKSPIPVVQTNTEVQWALLKFQCRHSQAIINLKKKKALKKLRIERTYLSIIKE